LGKEQNSQVRFIKSNLVKHFSLILEWELESDFFKRKNFILKFKCQRQGRHIAVKKLVAQQFSFVIYNQKSIIIMFAE